MASRSRDRNGYYVIVAKGDTLSAIAKTHANYTNPKNATYQTIAAWNDLGNPNLIYPNQKILLYNPDAPSSSSSETKPKIRDGIHRSMSDPNEVFAMWTWANHSQTARYEIQWGHKKLGDWFYREEAVQQTTNKYSFWNIPDNTVEIEFRVRAVAKENPKTKKPYWNTTGWQGWVYLKEGQVAMPAVPGSVNDFITKVVSYKCLECTVKENDDGTTTYTETKTELTLPDGQTGTEVLVDGVPIYTNYGRQVFSYTDSDNETVYFCKDDSKKYLVMSVENIWAEHETGAIVFEISKNGKVAQTTSGIQVEDGKASYEYVMEDGSTYAVRAKAKQTNNWVNSVESDWSDYSETFITPPSAPTFDKDKGCAVVPNTDSDEEGYTFELKWTGGENTDTFEIQYTTDRTNFDNSDNFTTTEVKGNLTSYKIGGFESNKTYYFRIRAINTCGESVWTETTGMVSSAPAAPTTWSSTTVIGVNDPVRMYWVHNSNDNSLEVQADIEVYAKEGDTTRRILSKTQSKAPADAEKGMMSFYEFKMETEDVLLYPEGVTLLWQVRTYSASGVAGTWSSKRTINVYKQPEIYITLTDFQNNVLGGEILYRIETATDDDGNTSYIATDEEVTVTTSNEIEGELTDTGKRVFMGLDSDGETVYFYKSNRTLSSFPIKISSRINAGTQSPVSYYVTVTSNDEYSAVDSFGNDYSVARGGSVYSKNFDRTDLLELSLSAGDMVLVDEHSYTVQVTVSMDSGLSATDTVEFTVGWDDTVYVPNAYIEVNPETLEARITPYCSLYNRFYRVLTRSGRTFEPTGEISYSAYGTEVANTTATIDDRILPVMYGTIGDGSTAYYCEDVEETKVTELRFSVYRREYDGSLTKIYTDIDGSLNLTVTDPHPALDYARYRIVAKYKRTGSVGYYDTPGYLVGEKSTIIQWAEEWTNFDVYGEDRTVMPDGYTGSMLKLPYNIDVSNKHNADVSFVEYIGRKHPVSYYGTQKGETATWNVDIDKNDKETLYALRRLAIWPGDVYVREPSGSGYWANVNVSFSQKHKEVVIPVTLDITRVEGGI